MLKFLIPLTELLSITANAAEPIYGYAIQCQNMDAKIRISARQWDDDFKFQSVGLDKMYADVFVKSDDQYDGAAKTLVTARGWFMSGLEMTAVGTAVGLILYVLGEVFKVG